MGLAAASLGQEFQSYQAVQTRVFRRGSVVLLNTIFAPISQNLRTNFRVADDPVEVVNAVI